LTRKIDTEHRPRKDLSHSTFGDDLFFFRHRAANIRRNVCLSTPRRLHRNWSSESIGRYSRSSSRFHHSPV
jgi:hypothetical protein